MSLTDQPIRVLVVDDEESVLRSLQRMLVQAGYEPQTAQSGEEALLRTAQTDFDVVLLDLRLPNRSGLEIIKELKSDSTVEVVMMTGFATVDDAVAAVKAGAYDFLTKPFASQEVVLFAIEKAAEHRRLVNRLHLLERELLQRGRLDEIIGQSPKMQQVFRLIESIAVSHSTVLITGESGTGKELVARAIHNRSPRRDKAFVPVNCAAIPEALLESELFGTVSGAFTGARDKRGLFEIANKGTLFLDEIGELSTALQAKLLRVLQEGELRRVGDTQGQKIDVRVIAATNINLHEARKKGAFREDLFYRLHVLPIRLPSLQERREDIPMLAVHFVRKHAKRNSKQIKGIEPDAIASLQRHRWSGNVRELESTIERAVVICQGDTLTDFDLNIAWEMGDERLAPPSVSSGTLRAIQPTSNFLSYAAAKQQIIEKFDREYVSQLLYQTSGNVTEAATQAGMEPSNFRRLMRRYGFRAAQFVRPSVG